MTRQSPRPMTVAALILGLITLSAYSQNGSEPPDDENTGEVSTVNNEMLELAMQGEALAQYTLGVMYDRGLSVMQNYREAVRWYRAAAEQGHTTAQFSLGVMYAAGEGVGRDYQEAFRWFRTLAEKGHGHAQNNLGDMYSKGQSVSQDYVLAHMWFNLAASNITDDYKEMAVKNRDMVAEKMTSEQIAEAVILALQWDLKRQGSQ